VSVGCLILTYRQPALVVDALLSLRQQGWPAEVHVLDNGDGSDAAAVEAEFERERGAGHLTVSVAPENLGVAGGRNWLAERADEDWLLFVDNDVEFTDAIGDFVAELDASPADLVFPVILDATGGRVWSAGGTYRPLLSWSRNGFHGLPPGSVDSDPSVAAAWGAGACLAVRAEAMRSLGGFDDGFGRYGAEDLDFCLRASKAGYELTRSRLAPVRHLDARTSLRGSRRNSSLSAAASIIRRRHAPPAGRPVQWLFWAIRNYR
jgi:GT2 family glycosyltransferase